ncbi:F131A protein, partial [Nothocercus julius]|nr:F131A protein [Nothocercus julius]
VAVDATLHVEWKEVKALPALSAARPALLHRLARQASFESQDFLEVNVEDTVEMLPKSRRALTIQEIAALARSSLHGSRRAGAHGDASAGGMGRGGPCAVQCPLREKGLERRAPLGQGDVRAPAATRALGSGGSPRWQRPERGARTAVGRGPWGSVAGVPGRAVLTRRRSRHLAGGEGARDEADGHGAGPRGPPHRPPGPAAAGALLRDLLHSQWCELSARHGSCEPESDSSRTLSPETLCSSLCSLEMVSPSELTAKLLGSLGGEDLLLPPLPPPGSQSALRGLARLRRRDPLYAVSCLSPADDELLLGKDFPLRRKVSDVASSGVVSLEEDEDEE